MVYLALLRGINVGGNNKVPMSDLKATFERAGMRNVSTYINSGNVIFETECEDAATVSAQLEAALEREFSFPVPVLVIDSERLLSLAEALSADWANDAAAKCDALFLWADVDSPESLNGLTIKPGIDEVIYHPGAILWRTDRAAVTRSGLMRIVGTDFYQRVTVRNCNTLRKLAEKVRALETT